MESDTTNDLLDKTTSSSESEQNELHPLHALQIEISKLPDLDPAKVQAVIKKIQSGNFAILGSEEEKLVCAQRIAQQIIDESWNS